MRDDLWVRGPGGVVCRSLALSEVLRLVARAVSFCRPVRLGAVPQTPEATRAESRTSSDDLSSNKTVGIKVGTMQGVQPDSSVPAESRAFRQPERPLKPHAGM
jgi:hypothetical protein